MWDALGRKANFYESFIYCLESIQRNDDPENRFDSKTVIEASGLLKQLQNPSFIILFQTCRYIYSYAESLSKQLQGSIIKIIKAYEMVSPVVEQLSDILPNGIPCSRAVKWYSTKWYSL